MKLKFIKPHFLPAQHAPVFTIAYIRRLIENRIWHVAVVMPKKIEETSKTRWTIIY